jgi:Tfp pilus assembly protein PilZ
MTTITKLAEGDTLSLKFIFPNAPEYIYVQGKVAWTKPQPQGFHETGIEFLDLDDENINRIKKLITILER